MGNIFFGRTYMYRAVKALIGLLSNIISFTKNFRCLGYGRLRTSKFQGIGQGCNWLVMTHAGFSLSNYDDVIGERRGSSDLRWAAQEWQACDSCFDCHKRPQHDVFSSVLNSKRVKDAIAKEVEVLGKSIKELQEDVLSILQTMGHRLEIAAIRQFAFVLPKIMKTIYNKILVHKLGVEKLRKALRQHPVVLVPTHRSYADFLLISYLTFHYKLPFPVIAAGMDFFHMVYIGALLRRAGAFYIRRTFMEDDLYWAVFQEYIKILVCYEESPMEFFLEGTRSRTAKSLRPKLGLLGCVCECCWRGHTQDVWLVPINISYSRTLEETLYAYELLGVPKPKESTYGLLKATSILNTSYGDIFVHFGDPVSVREYLRPDTPLKFSRIDLSPLSVRELAAVEKLGTDLILKQQDLAVVSTFSIASCWLLVMLQHQQTPIAYNEMLRAVSCLLESLKLFSQFKWDGDDIYSNVDEALRVAMDLHSNIVQVDSSGHLHFATFSADCSPNRGNGAVVLHESVVQVAVLHLLLQHYANQCLHLLVRPALALHATALLLHTQNTVSLQLAKERFKKLQAIFYYEFIFAKNFSDKDFDDAVEGLIKCGCLEKSEDELMLNRNADTPIAFVYAGCLKPFLLTHIWSVIIASQQEWRKESELVERIQAMVQQGLLQAATNTEACRESARNGESLVLQELLTPLKLIDVEDGVGHKYFSSLCLDSCRNAVRSLFKLNALKSVITKGSSNRLVTCRKTLQDIYESLTGVNLLPFDVRHSLQLTSRL